MDWIRWISMTMSERILIMVKNKVVLKERDAWSDLANFIGDEQYKRLMAYMKALQKLEQMENMVEE